MKTYMVSYDLNAPGKDYVKLFHRLEELGFTRVLYSQWIAAANATSNWTSEVLRNDLARFIDANDSLLVTRITNDTAWIGLKLTTTPVLQQMFA